MKELFEVDTDRVTPETKLVEDLVPKVKAYTDAVEASGLATTLLVAPFYRTVVGTDRYVDELWP